MSDKNSEPVMLPTSYKPELYTTTKWDTTLGLDYSEFHKPYPKTPHHQYVHHQFPPLFKNTKVISHYDIEGKGDGFQLAKQGDYVYYCHFFSAGLSVIDVKDPTKPEAVAFIPTGSRLCWSIKCRVIDNILVIANQYMGGGFSPRKYALPPPALPRAGPNEPVQGGVKIYDVSKPAEPKLLSFWKTGGWNKREGVTGGVHRFWYDGHYAYLSSTLPGYAGAVFQIVDLLDPKDPQEVSRFWMPGQWTEGGERGDGGGGFHHIIAQGNRAYGAVSNLGGAIIDISNIKRPTLIKSFEMDGTRTHPNHTFLPIKDRKFAIMDHEMRHGWMLDISNEMRPYVISMFPYPPKELLERGYGWPWGPSLHNIHENCPGSDSYRSDDRIYTACGAAGLRIYDVSDPYRIEEIGYYVPGTPKVYYDPRGPEWQGMDVNEVWVDKKGIMYISQYNNGLEIVEFTG